MKSESSDLRYPTAARQRCWDVLGYEGRLRLQDAPRAAQSNTWVHAPTWTSTDLPGRPVRVLCHLIVSDRNSKCRQTSRG